MYIGSECVGDMERVPLRVDVTGVDIGIKSDEIGSDVGVHPLGQSAGHHLLDFDFPLLVFLLVLRLPDVQQIQLRSRKHV